MKPSAIILVGGQGTRLRPLTLHQPKALLPILNRPFLSFQFDSLSRAGITDVCLAANPWFRRWKRAVEKLAPRSMTLHWAFEPKPLGTGGAIRFGYNHLKKIQPRLQTVIVFNGDVLLSENLTRILNAHVRKKADATIVLTRVSDPSRFGLVKFGSLGRIQEFKEKPKNARGSGWINAGFYILSREFLESIPAGQVLSIERDIFPQQLKLKRRLFAEKMKGYWNDIGTPATYLSAQKDLLKQNHIWTVSGNLSKGSDPRKNLAFLKGPKTRVDPSCRLSGLICLGKDVKLDARIVASDLVAMDGCHIGPDCELTGVVLGRDCKIGHGSILSEGTVLGDGTNLLPYSKS